MATRDDGPTGQTGDCQRPREGGTSIPLPSLRTSVSLKRRTAFRRHAGRPLRRPSSPIPTAWESVVRMIDETWHLEPDWRMDERWAGIIRPYGPDDVVRLRGTIRIRHTLAERGAGRLWSLLNSQDYVPALGALTGNQAIQQVRAGLRAIYLSGWQVAADGNDAGQMYPDLSLYPADSVPNVVRRINNALRRKHEVDWFVPIVADAEAGFGGPLHAFELMKAMIEAGAAGVHFEDQLAAAKKCGHLGGKVVVPTSEFVQKLVAARLAADVMGVRTLIVARTDANSARLITGDADPADHSLISGERTTDGFFQFEGGLHAAIARGLAYAQLQDEEFAARERGYRATEHQAFVGTEFFDAVGQVISGGTSSTLAMNGSTEREQIADANARVTVSTPS